MNTAPTSPAPSNATSSTAQLPTQDTVALLTKQHGEAAMARADIGVRQVALRWNNVDGTPQEFTAFCVANFVANPSDVTRLLDRLEKVLTSVSGHLYEIRRDLRWWSDVKTDSFAGVDDASAGAGASADSVCGAWVRPRFKRGALSIFSSCASPHKGHCTNLRANWSTKSASLPNQPSKLWRAEHCKSKTFMPAASPASSGHSIHFVTTADSIRSCHR